MNPPKSGWLEGRGHGTNSDIDGIFRLTRLHNQKIVTAFVIRHTARAAPNRPAMLDSSCLRGNTLRADPAFQKLCEEKQP
jgi:hypothetical protein